jgi:uncharacterized membrane protein (GlpM family)
MCSAKSIAALRTAILFSWYALFSYYALFGCALFGVKRRKRQIDPPPLPLPT